MFPAERQTATFQLKDRDQGHQTSQSSYRKYDITANGRSYDFILEDRGSHTASSQLHKT